MKPILFNTEMVKAILDGRKTVTRRVVKPQPMCYGTNTTIEPHNNDFFLSAERRWLRCRICGNDPEYSREGSNISHHWNSPYDLGDILYVRETWAYGYVDTTDFECRCNECFFEELKAGTEKDSFLMPRYFYRTENLDGLNVRWHPSIHMPKEAARLFLRVTGVRVERLQDITYEGCKAEGFDGSIFTDDTEGLPAIAINRFSKLWDSTVPKHPNKFKSYKYYWKDNPWVWVIEFERISQKEAMSEGQHVD